MERLQPEKRNEDLREKCVTNMSFLNLLCCKCTLYLVLHLLESNLKVIRIKVSVPVRSKMHKDM